MHIYVGPYTAHHREADLIVIFGFKHEHRKREKKGKGRKKGTGVDKRKKGTQLWKMSRQLFCLQKENGQTTLLSTPVPFQKQKGFRV